MQKLPEDLHDRHYKQKDSRAKGRSIDAADLLSLHKFKTKGRSILGGRRLALFESGRIGIVPKKSEPEAKTIMTTPLVLIMSLFFVLLLKEVVRVCLCWTISITEYLKERLEMAPGPTPKPPDVS